MSANLHRVCIVFMSRYLFIPTWSLIGSLSNAKSEQFPTRTSTPLPSTSLRRRLQRPHNRLIRSFTSTLPRQVQQQKMCNWTTVSNYYNVFIYFIRRFYREPSTSRNNCPIGSSSDEEIYRRNLILSYAVVIINISSTSTSRALFM